VTDGIFQIVTGALLIESVKAVVTSWGVALGLAPKQIRELELGEFLTKFDMTKRLIEGNYCKFDEETKQLFLFNSNFCKINTDSCNRESQ